MSRSSCPPVRTDGPSVDSIKMPAGAPMYQRQQALSYGIAGIDTKVRAVETEQIRLFSLVIKPKWGFYTCSNAPCVSAEFNA